MTAGDDGILRIRRVDKKGEVTVEELPRTAPIRCFEALPDGRIVTGTEDGRLGLWHKNTEGTWRCDETNAHRGAINSLKALANGSLVTGGDDGIVKEWRVTPYAIQHCRDLRGHTNAVKSVDMLPDGTILSGSSDRTIRLWREKPTSLWSKMMGTTNPSQPTCEVLKGHTSDVMCATFMRDGSIISGSLDGTVRIWQGR
jgi:WD40 repeat protein